MSPSGDHWRCGIGPDTLFYRDHGANLRDAGFSETQTESSSARYSSGDENRYFGWSDAEGADARSLADKFLDRFATLARKARGGATPTQAGIKAARPRRTRMAAGRNVRRFGIFSQEDQPL